MLSVIKPSIWFIILIVGFPQLSETIFAPLLPSIVEKFQTTQTLSQMSLSVFFFGFGFGVFIWGSLSDRIGRKKALLFGVLCYALGSFLLFTASNIYIFLAYRVLQAFGAASGSIVAQTILRECFHDPKERVATFSTVSAALAWTPALGPLLGGQLVAFLGMGSVFIFLTVLGLTIFFCTQLTLKEVQKESIQNVKFGIVLQRMIKDPQIYLNTLLVAGLNSVIFSIYSESPFVFMNTFEWSPRSYSFTGVGMALFSVLGSRINKALAYGGVKAAGRIKIGLLSMIFSGFLYALPTLLGFESHTYFKMGWMLLSLCLIFMGIVVSLPNILGEALNSYKDCLGTAGALFGLGYYLVISFLLAFISSFSSENLLFIGALVGGLSFAMLLLSCFLVYHEASKAG
jgi:MFS family permease